MVRVYEYSKMALSSKKGYSMTVTLIDESGTHCPVILSDTVIQSRLGISAKEAKDLRQTELGATSVVQKLTEFYCALDAWKTGPREATLEVQESGDVFWIWS
jgi:hypothetical protein